ncbi:MAG: ABC-F family ATP-binding cassette domain-containing protein [Desulfofustis sp.]|nr:ABC-F family ATP-binding cassette domain-containing protein [Desulfofustis sp.]
MATILSCRAISKAYGAQKLFSGLNLVIHDGDRIGLIGPNGSGKSTLLRILCGLEDVDEGGIDRRSNLIFSYLAQEDVFIEHLGPLENLLEPLKDSPLSEAEKLNRAQALLSRIELDNHQHEVSLLSGGWRKRLSICRALVIEPDLLVLDEPTNHLDIEGIIWLEGLIGSNSPMSPPSFVVVSHDRRFLETCTSRIIELSNSYPDGMFQVDDTYSGFLEKKVQFLEQQHKLEQTLANKVRRETEWLRRGPKARTSKAKYRIDEAQRLHEQLDSVKSHNRVARDIDIDFTATGRKTKKLMEVNGLGLTIDGKVLVKNLSFIISPGTRIGLVGRNGCGKSSLLNLLYSCALGKTEVNQGSVRVAENLAVANFTQDRRALDQRISLRRALAPDSDGVVFRGRSLHVVSWAKRFQFTPDQLDTPVGTMSGGEQARILIADLMRQPADILLLDEPTNDLDIGSLDVLEESLLDFPGGLILVTHDRYLLERVCDMVLGFVGDGVITMFGDYGQWLRALDGDAGSSDGASGTEKKKKQSDGNRKSGRLSYLDQLEYDQMEEKILTAEKSCEELEKKITDPELAADPVQLQSVWQQLDQARQRVDQLYRRWDELERKKSQ